MPGFHTAVATNIERPAFLGGDHTHVLALCFGALARAAGHGKLDLVRGTQALVTVLELDRESNAILHTVAAPARTHTGFDGTQGLAVSVTGFEAGRDQLFPDQRQLVHLGAQQVDALTAGDFGVEAELLRHLADGNEFVRRDFPARNPRYHRIGTILLN